MKITDLSLKRTVAVTVLVVATFFTGLFSLTQLDVNYRLHKLPKLFLKKISKLLLEELL